ncbi:MAG TPA: AAA family ATPase [Acidimicrobiales bacterium]|nr:AAA family ATPase [Acidimicrobiales bacterium]
MEAVSISGLQGTGKTTLARALGIAMDAAVFSRDPIMDVLQAGGVPMEPDAESRIKSYPELGYDLLTALLRTQLELGHAVVLECVVEPKVREQWKQVAEGAGSHFWIVDTICSDPEIHRERFQNRGRTRRGDWCLPWETVERYRTGFQPHPQAAYVADAVRPVGENVAAILRIVEGTI